MYRVLGDCPGVNYDVAAIDLQRDIEFDIAVARDGYKPREGINAENSATVIFESDEDIRKSAKKNGIKSNNNAVVRIAQTVTPIDNNIFIASLNENGIRAAGSSEVIIDPENTCTISGGTSKPAINQSGAATVDPDGCTLSNG